MERSLCFFRCSLPPRTATNNTAGLGVEGEFYSSYDAPVKRLKGAFRAISTSTHYVDESWSLERHPLLSGVVFARFSDLRTLETHLVIPPGVLFEIREEAKICRGFVFGVRRSPHADIYVIAGEDDASIKDALDAFLRFDQRFEGVGVSLGAPARSTDAGGR